MLLATLSVCKFIIVFWSFEKVLMLSFCYCRAIVIVLVFFVVGILAIIIYVICKSKKSARTKPSTTSREASVVSIVSVFDNYDQVCIYSEENIFLIVTVSYHVPRFLHWRKTISRIQCDLIYTAITAREIISDCILKIKFDIKSNSDFFWQL